MVEIEIYVVRIYRDEPSEPLGVIEVVETGEQLPFRTTRELWRTFLRLVSDRRPRSNQRDS